MAVIRKDHLLRSGHRLSYRTAGAGDTALVCVHGLAQSGLIWESVIADLPVGIAGYAVDLLGFGDSDKPESGYSIAAHAHDVGDFIDSLSARRIVLAANSLGGVVAMSLALEAPTKLHGLVLAGTGPKVRDPEKLKRYRDHLASLEMSPENLRTIARGYCYNELAAAELESIAREIGKARRSAILETMTSSLTTDLTSELGRIALPTLIVQGLLDEGRPPEDGLAIARGLKDARLVVLPRVGHTPMLDAPADFQELLVAALRRWTDGDRHVGSQHGDRGESR